MEPMEKFWAHGATVAHLVCNEGVRSSNLLGSTRALASGPLHINLCEAASRQERESLIKN